MAMKFVKTFLSYFFGLGAVLIALDELVFEGGIEEMVSLPGPMKYAIGVVIFGYWGARLCWFVYEKFFIEARERLLDIKKKEQEINNPGL